jgi:hypothetical protein
MTTPEVRAACDDLRADADKWSVAAEALRGAAQAAQGLTLLDKLGQIPQLAGSGKSVAGYEEFRAKAVASLAAGAGVLADISALLTQAADTYEREDIAGAHRVSQAGADK